MLDPHSDSLRHLEQRQIDLFTIAITDLTVEEARQRGPGFGADKPSLEYRFNDRARLDTVGQPRRKLDLGCHDIIGRVAKMRKRTSLDRQTKKTRQGLASQPIHLSR